MAAVPSRAGPPVRHVLLTLLLLFAVAGPSPARAQSAEDGAAAAPAAVADKPAARGVAPAAAGPARLTVRAFEVRGASLLPAERLQRELRPWLGDRGLDELRAAAAAVQAAYARDGWGGVVAWLPPQDARDGTVTIQVLEGRLARVQRRAASAGASSSPTRHDEARLQAALPGLRVGQTPRLRLLDAQLQLANENPSRQLGLLLAPGAAPGEIDATVTVQERSPWRGWLGLDNSGNRPTGWQRLSLGLQHADLSGHDDVLSLTAVTSPERPERVRVGVLGYRWPAPSWQGTLDLFGAWSSVASPAQRTAVGDVRLGGRGRVAGLRWTRVLQRTGRLDHRVSVAFEQRDYLNQCELPGFPAEVCGAAGVQVRTRPLTLDWQSQAGALDADSVSWNSTLAWSGQLAASGRMGDAAAYTAARAGARPRYGLWRLQAQAQWPLGAGWSLGGRLALQHTGDALIAGEQFGLGGAASVRGYLEREQIGDQGWTASAELLSPRLGGSAAAADWRLLAFVDGGAVEQADGSACFETQTRCRATAAGVGSRLAWGPVQLRLAAAQARRTAASTERGQWRGHVALQAGF